MDVREKYVMQKVNRKEKSICPNCIHHNLCIAENNQPCFECNRFIDAHGVTVQEWISVKDERKPKQLQECLCVCQFDDDTKGEWRFYNVLKWHDVPYQNNGIVNRPHFTDEGVHGMVVTHWMPLPKLPQPPKGE